VRKEGLRNEDGAFSKRLCRKKKGEINDSATTVAKRLAILQSPFYYRSGTENGLQKESLRGILQRALE